MYNLLQFLKFLFLVGDVAGTSLSDQNQGSYHDKNDKSDHDYFGPRNDWFGSGAGSEFNQGGLNFYFKYTFRFWIFFRNRN